MPQPRSRRRTAPPRYLPGKPMTLQEEAIETSRRAFYSQGKDANLRHKPVPFISAGTENPLEISITPPGAVNADCPFDTRDGCGTLVHEPNEECGSSSNAMEMPYETARSGNRMESRRRGSRAPRTPSPADTDSSERTVLLFKGRRTRVGEDMRLPSVDAITVGLQDMDCGPAASLVLSPKGQFRTGSEEQSTHHDPCSPTGEAFKLATIASSDESGRASHNIFSIDYLENALEHEGHVEVPVRFSGRDLGGSDNEVGLSSQEVNSEIDLPALYVETPMVSCRRPKKAELKKLRAQGMLLNNNSLDLWTRYPTTMTMGQVVDEVRQFLLSTAVQLSFPPLPAPFRKAIHEMAHRLSLKSKSIGQGHSRRPVLYRTKRTARYSDQLFDSVTLRLVNRWCRNNRNRANSARDTRSTMYRDGDIVGQGAPELGLDNRGWGMMLKMGWRRGSGLGTTENKGILQPVTQVVKRTKAGLG